MTSPSANESESRQIEGIEQEIDRFRLEHAEVKSKILDFLRREDPVNGITFHEDIFRLQQEKLRLDTEILFRQAQLRRLKSSW
jgi:hypothetical protein